MGNAITTTIEYDGKENYKTFIKPLFVGKSPLETQGIRIMPNIQSKMQLNNFSNITKTLKAWTQGFNPSTGTVYTRREIDVYRMGSEIEQGGDEFWQTIYEQLLASGAEMSDISKSKGKLIEELVVKLWKKGLASDIYRQFWLSDTAKETVVDGVSTGVADNNYNAYEGIWKIIFENAAETPTATQIKLFNYDASAVKQVQTATMTGQSGSANLLVEGINYLNTFDTSLTISNVNFITAHAAALLLRGFVVTASTTTLIFTSTVPGSEKGVITVVTVLTMAGSVAQTTANTAPTALSQDQAWGLMKTMYAGAPAELKSLKKTEKVFQVDGYTYENLLSTYETKTATAGQVSTEGGRVQMINGVEFISFRGVPVLNLDWENDLDADFPHVTGELPARPYRIIYTKNDNLVLAIDALSSFSKFKMWYNEDQELNRFRFRIKMGANYVWNNVMCVAYEV